MRRGVPIKKSHAKRTNREFRQLTTIEEAYRFPWQELEDLIRKSLPAHCNDCVGGAASVDDLTAASIIRSNRCCEFDKCKLEG
jgi:hypothetical protein